MTTIILTPTSSSGNYDLVRSLAEGSVFGYSLELPYETMMRRLFEGLPTDTLFEVTPITPGTSLYTLYGCNHCIVTHENNNIP